MPEPRFSKIEASVKRFKARLHREGDRIRGKFVVAQRAESPLNTIRFAAIDELKAAVAQQFRKRHGCLQVAVEFECIRPAPEPATNLGGRTANSGVLPIRAGPQLLLEER